MNYFHTPFCLAIATLSIPTVAQFGGGGGFGPGDGTDGFGNPVGGSSGSGDDVGLGFDISTTTKQRSIHGILASVAFVILFPLGAIAMAVVRRGRWGFWVHLLLQMVGWVLFVAAAVLGFLMLREVRIPGSDGAGWLIYDPDTKYHPIIGIVVLILVVFQPVFGWLHHRVFQVQQRRTLVSYLHLINGRLLIVLGIVNGGLGLKVSNASDMIKLAYTIVAAILGGAWLIITLLSEGRKMRGKDVWGGKGGRRGARRNGKSVRMDRIDKAVSQRGGSEDGHHYGGAEGRYA